MKVVIDVQGAQTANRFRGIGRYCLQLIKSIIQQAPRDEFHILLNSNLVDGAKDIRNELSPYIQPSRFHAWQGPEPFSAELKSSRTRRQMACDIQHKIIQRIQPDLYFIPSLFEGYIENAVVRPVDRQFNVPTIAVFYDLIPLINPTDYLEGIPGYTDFYMDVIDDIKKVDHLLTISESSKKEAVDCLGLAEENITNIYAGVDSRFVAGSDNSHGIVQSLEARGIDKPYFIYSGGADARKNLTRLIKAFAHLSNSNNEDYQLVLVGKMQQGIQDELKKVISKEGLTDRDVVFTGFVDDDFLILLYQHSLAHVFPSWHEGFGLPALEAMSCGTAALVSNLTSLPEIVNNTEALFDPYDELSIANKMQQVIDDPEFRERLVKHGLKRAEKFTWESCAQQALAAFKKVSLSNPDISRCDTTSKLTEMSKKMPRVAIVTPMPPEQTGIADYMYELLPALDKCFEVNLVVHQIKSDIPNDLCRSYIKNEEWFMSHANEMDHIIYQMGNSVFHRPVFDLMKIYPGLLVLHDFYLSDLLGYMELLEPDGHHWQKALLNSHGYSPIIEYLSAKQLPNHDRNEALTILKKRYPCNLELLDHATQVVIHSNFSKELAIKFYGEIAAGKISSISLPRGPRLNTNKSNARKELGISDEVILVSSFGILAPSKLNHMLLEIWPNVQKQKKVELVFVGKPVDEEYEAKLKQLMKLYSNVKITGWVDKASYHKYLAASDIAVQLRTSSRGETSASVLDALNYSLPTIINANGSMAEINPNAVSLLDDDFSLDQLTTHLNELIENEEKRAGLAFCATQLIEDEHRPERYVEELSLLLNQPQLTAESAVQQLLQKWTNQHTLTEVSDPNLIQLAKNLVVSFPVSHSPKKVYLDMTATLMHDLNTGIERYAKALAKHLLIQEEYGIRFELVSLKKKKNGWGYHTKRKQFLSWLGFDSSQIDEEWVELTSNDSLITLDLAVNEMVKAEEQVMFFSELKARGVKLYATLFDLLPVQMPQYFPPGASETFESWLNVISYFNGAFSISESTKRDFQNWLKVNHNLRRDFDIHVVPMGVDEIKQKEVGAAIRPNFKTILEKPYFLMVGTIEPRKGHAQVIEAFELLSHKDTFNLIVVGQEGWKGLPDSERRSLPAIVDKLHSHNKKKSNISWLNDVNDQELAIMYSNSRALIAASEGEGFGLPLIEAMRHGCPLIARDIDVFRDVSEGYADFFKNDLLPEILAEYLVNWIAPEVGNRRRPEIKSWKDTANAILSVITLDIEN